MAGTDGTGESFAERMMKNMGWSQGKGLGREEEGMREFIKPKMKFNTKGVGFNGVDNKWIAHQEHFDDLLTSLNKGEKPAEKKDLACLTSVSKLRGRTKFYAKMMRGKDLSNRSSQDISAIIVPLSKKRVTERPETNPLPSELTGSLKSSQLSMSDYFATMMAQRKSKLRDESGSNTNVNRENCANTDDRQGKPMSDAKRAKKDKKKERANEPEEPCTPCDSESIEALYRTKKNKRKSRKVDSIETLDRERTSDDPCEVEDGAKNPELPKRRSKKLENLPVIEAEDCFDEKLEKQTKKSRKHRSPERRVEELAHETHNGDAHVKQKKKKTKGEECPGFSLDLESREAAAASDESVPSKRNKMKKPKTKRIEDEFEISEDGTRLNIDVDLLKEIRGSKLARSKAEPLRDLTDDQIQEIHRLWTSGEYSEFMRRVHSGELPRWVAVEKSQLERMMMGRTKLIDLADVREVVQTKWRGANVEEIWGYTNVAYLAV